jgi:hypothetical protein
MPEWIEIALPLFFDAFGESKALNPLKMSSQLEEYK